MLNVKELIHSRLDGTRDLGTLAIVAEDGGQRWVVLAGMVAHLEAHGLRADIYGGASAGALTCLYYAAGQAADGALLIPELSRRGYSHNGKRFIDFRRLLVGQPVMDVHGLVHEVFANNVPLNWQRLQQVRKRKAFVTVTHPDARPQTVPIANLDVHSIKGYAETTARIPVIGGKLSQHKLWDGGISNGLPIGAAFGLGATHVLALRSRAPGDAPDTLKEKLTLAPAFRGRSPQLLKALLERDTVKQHVVRDYELSPWVQFVSCDHDISTFTDDPQLMVQGWIKGWNAIAQTLELPKAPLPWQFIKAAEKLKL